MQNKNISTTESVFIRNTYKAYKQAVENENKKDKPISDRLIEKMINRIFDIQNKKDQTSILFFKEDGSFIEYINYNSPLEIDIDEIESVSASCNAKYTILSVLYSDLNRLEDSDNPGKRIHKMLDLMCMKNSKFYAYYLYISVYNKFVRIYEG